MKSLQKLEREHSTAHFHWGLEGNESTLLIDGASALALPGTEFLDQGWRFKQFPRCLIHGDMHGGNVMAEMITSNPSALSANSGGHSIARVCLIDYRSAGPGPRCMDAVALESSIRIADAEQIAIACGGDSAKTVAGTELSSALASAARQSSAERQMYGYLLLGSRAKPLSSTWCKLAVDTVRGLQSSFSKDPITPEEYVQTALLYAIRQLGYSVDAVVRVRLCAWLAALYAIGQEIF